MCCGVAVLVVCKHMYDVIRPLSDVLEDFFFIYIYIYCLHVMTTKDLVTCKLIYRFSQA